MRKRAEWTPFIERRAGAGMYKWRRLRNTCDTCNASRAPLRPSRAARRSTRSHVSCVLPRIWRAVTQSVRRRASCTLSCSPCSAFRLARCRAIVCALLRALRALSRSQLSYCIVDDQAAFELIRKWLHCTQVRACVTFWPPAV